MLPDMPESSSSSLPSTANMMKCLIVRSLLLKGFRLGVVSVSRVVAKSRLDPLVDAVMFVVTPTISLFCRKLNCSNDGNAINDRLKRIS